MSFKALEGDTVLLVQSGVWKTADLYELDGALFAKFGGGFIRLKHNGTTSKDGVNFHQMATERQLFQDIFGRLTVSEGINRKPAMLENKSDF